LIQLILQIFKSLLVSYWYALGMAVFNSKDK